jgi:hypothetical protein
MLARIKRFADANSDKIILGTGDKDQLEPVGELTNNKIVLHIWNIAF